uniref:Putative secreted protein n=1 Tax=Anopheles marajoara TaxID=58244 RepID=A0A2M4CCK1_9DIPT
MLSARSTASRARSSSRFSLPLSLCLSLCGTGHQFASSPPFSLEAPWSSLSSLFCPFDNGARSGRTDGAADSLRQFAID